VSPPYTNCGEPDDGCSCQVGRGGILVVHWTLDLIARWALSNVRTSIIASPDESVGEQ
jgi:hypothetical protein